MTGGGLEYIPPHGLLASSSEKCAISKCKGLKTNFCPTVVFLVWYCLFAAAIIRDVFIGTVYMDINNIHSLITCNCGIINSEYSKIMQFTAWFYFCIPVANSK